MSQQERVTELVRLASESGDGVATSELLPIVYEEMRALAAHFASAQRPGHTLQATALAHEAYMRLTGDDGPDWNGKAHFMAVAAKAMRQILANHARAKRADKRGGGWQRVSLSVGSGVDVDSEVDLTRLAEADPRQAQVVELRFFGGLTVAETARMLDVSERTVELDWRMARAWLRATLEDLDHG
jgi:RNA polymerase sigma factor (TIGR02999 family)